MRTPARALLLPLLLAGCFDEGAPDGTQIACESAADCPPGWLCRASLGRCLKSEGLDETPPGLDGAAAVAPSAVALGAVLAVEFKVTEPLLQDPVVRVATNLPLLLSETGTDRGGLVYRYTRQATGEEPQGAAAPVTVDLVDRAGNTGEKLSAGSARFDFVTPALASSTPIAPALCGDGANPSVSFALTEEPSEAPVVVAEGPGGAQASWGVTQDGVGAYTAHYPVTKADAEGEWQVKVSARDAAGNRAAGMPLGRTTVDHTPPSLRSAARISLPVATVGRAVVVELEPSEAVAVGAALTARSGGVELAFSLEASAGVLVFKHTVATGEDGTWTLRLSKLKDLAGNEASAQDVGEVTFDGAPPTIGSLVVTPARASDKSGHTTVTASFTLDEPAASLVATLAGRDMTCTTSGPQASCTFEVRSSDPEGSQVVSVRAVDVAGNDSDASARVELDFTAPALVPGSAELRLAVPAGCPLLKVGALGADGLARLQFSLDEAVAPFPVVTTEGADPLAFLKEASSAMTFVYAGALGPGSHVGGARVLTVTATDDVGNSATTRLTSLPLTVDVEPPAAPDTATAGRVVYERVPWGSAATGGLARFAVAGGSGAAEAGATVRALDSAAADSAAEVGRAQADGKGAFAMDLLRADRPVVYLTALDAACNQSDAADVKEVAWTATLGGKRAGSPFENPHVLEARGTFARVLEGSGATEPMDVGFVALPGGNALSLTGASGGWHRFQPDGMVAPAGCYHSMVYDTARRRAVLVGSLDFVGQVQDDLWEWDGAAWKQRVRADPEGDGNPALQNAVLAYDSGRERLVLYTGWVDGMRSDAQTWEWDGNSWAKRTSVDPEGDGDPTFRYGPGLAYDSVRGKVVMFGGAVNTSPLAETWEWDGASWARRTPADPEKDGDPPGTLHGVSLVFDASRGKAVLLRNGYSAPTDGAVWEWDGASWAKVVPADPEKDGNPGDRSWGSTSYDPVRKVVLIHGTYANTGGSVNDLWEWNGASWRKLVDEDLEGEGAPTYGGYCGVFDPVRRVLTSVIHDNSEAQTWEWAGRSWARRTPVTPALPTPRTAVLAYDEARRRTVLLGGELGDGITWEYDGGRWRAASPDDPTGTKSPGHHLGHTLSFDPTRARTVLLGGFDAVGTPDVKLWSWDGSAWSVDSSTAPVLSFHAASVEPSGRLVAFGADPLVGNLQTHLWEKSGWSVLDTPHAPPYARYSSAAAYDPVRARLVTFGGDGAFSYEKDTWEFDGSDWTLADAGGGKGKPAARTMAGAAYHQGLQRVVMFGGAGDDIYGDLWDWDGKAWSQRAATSTTPDGPYGRMSAGVAYDAARDRLIVFGGYGMFVPHNNETWEWDAGASNRPGLVARFAFAAAGEGSYALQSVSALWKVGADGQVAHAPTAGVQGWVYDKGTFLAENTAGFAAATPGDLSWSTADPWRLARILQGSRKELVLAVTPQGTNGSGTAGVSVDYVEATVRYRRP